MSAKNLNVVVWNEYRHEKLEEACRNIYPDGIHGLIKSFLEADDASLNVRLAALDDPDQGLPDEVLNETDVLLWWASSSSRFRSQSSSCFVLRRSRLPSRCF